MFSANGGVHVARRAYRVVIRVALGARQLGGARGSCGRSDHLVEEGAVVLDDGGFELVVDEREELEGEDVDDHVVDGAVLKYHKKVGQEDERVVEEGCQDKVCSPRVFRSQAKGGRQRER